VQAQRAKRRLLQLGLRIRAQEVSHEHAQVLDAAAQRRQVNRRGAQARHDVVAQPAAALPSLPGAVRLVAAMTRTSMRRGRVDPAGSARVLQKRSSLI